MNQKIKRCDDISNETGSSNWLSVISVRQFNCVLNKQQLWDSIRLRYGWPIPGLRLVARVEKASMFGTPRHARREDSLHCDTSKCEI